MAAALFNALADPSAATGISAGTEPGTTVHPEVIAAMREDGIDLAVVAPQKLTDALASRAHLPLEDPKGKPIERVREIKAEIGERVRALLASRGWLRPVCEVLT